MRIKPINKSLKLASIIIISIFFLSCRNSNETDEVSNATWNAEIELRPLSVEVLEVSKGQLIPYIEASGVIYGSKEAWVISESQGKITDLKVSLGQIVKKNDIILKVEDNLAQLNKDLALQQYEASQFDFQAIEKSYQSGGFSKSDYNTARTNVLQAQANFELANKRYNDTTIRAPFDGSIAQLDNNLTIGNYLNPGMAVAKIIDTSSMKMEISLGERQVNLIEPGLEALVNITSLNAAEDINATVQAIGSGSDSSTGSFPVLLSWNNKTSSSIRSGLSAKVQIKTLEKNRSIIIPSSAIVIRNRKRAVIIAQEEKSLLRFIETGESLGGHTVVNSGLDEGELLIVSALSSLGEDYEVKTTVVGTTGDWR